jgi:putative glycosyltransferase (TIGR04372 family)
MSGSLARVAGSALDRGLRLVAPLLVRLHVRVYQANLHRIGDTNLELARYVKWRELGWSRRERALVIPAPTGRRVANAAAIEYLGRHVRIVTHPLAYPLLFRLRNAPGLGGNLDDDVLLPDGRRAVYWLGSTAAEQVWNERGRTPLLVLRPADRLRGREALTAIGVPAGAEFVCLHAREGGYLRERTDSHHRQKNVDVESYLEAVETIVARGCWVVRMGDPSMKRLPPLDGVVDYAHSAAKGDWLDVFLAASCRFWLGSNSGLYMLAENFGVPVAMANAVPHSYRIWGQANVVIFKLYQSKPLGRLLTFGESLAPGLFHAQDLDPNGIRAIDNTPEEIAELASEMLDRTAGTAVYGAADEERQRRYDALTPYYPFGISSRIGREFLRRHEHLIDAGAFALPNGELPVHPLAGHAPARE